MSNGKKKAYETLGKAGQVAGKAAVPLGLGAGGALVGALGLRFIAAKYSPAAYARTWVPYALGIGGAVAGAAVASLAVVEYKTKAGRERAYKATLPLVMLGATAVGGLVSFGPRLWKWFRDRYPNVAAALNPSRQLALPPPTVQQAPAPDPTRSTQMLTGGSEQMLYSRAGGRAGGLSPRQWARLEQRAAGLRASSTSQGRWV